MCGPGAEIELLMEEDMKEDKLTREQHKELKQLQKEMIEDAKKVVKDYKDNPSDMSGSVTQIHENSPYLATREERLKTLTGLDEFYSEKNKKSK